MILPEFPEFLEVVRTPGTCVLAAARKRGRFMRAVEIYRLVEVPLAPCGHEACPPLDYVYQFNAWTVRGGIRRATRIARNQYVRQIAEYKSNAARRASEALGG